MRKITIFDTTLRDGEQAPGAAMAAADRLAVALALEKAGADYIEAGFPAASRIVAESATEISRQVESSAIAVFSRAVAKDIDTAWEAVREAKQPRLHVCVATSDIHLDKKLRMSRDQVVEAAISGVKHAKRYCGDVEFSAEDATRSDREYLARVFQAAIRAGATSINVPDTVGFMLPWEFAELITYLRGNVAGIENVVLGVHTHDDLGLAVANALSAVQVGAQQVDCTVNGIGERAGNCALEELVAAISLKGERLGVTTSFVAAELCKLSRLVADVTEMPVQRNKAVVGANAFLHQSGIHQDGMLKDRTTYEILDPASVGATSDLLLGRHSGRAALRATCTQHEIVLDPADQGDFEKAFQKYADNHRYVTPEEVRKIADGVKSESKNRAAIAV